MEATMTAEVSVQASDSLEELRQRFEQWRAGRRQGQRIPEAKWMDAAKEARARSAYRVARALRLGYAMLKHRAASNALGNGKPGVAVRQDAAFQRGVELVLDEPRQVGAVCGLKLLPTAQLAAPRPRAFVRWMPRRSRARTKARAYPMPHRAPVDRVLPACG